MASQPARLAGMDMNLNPVTQSDRIARIERTQRRILLTMVGIFLTQLGILLQLWVRLWVR